MTWAELAYSKKAIRRAGDYLIATNPKNLDISQFIESFEILNNWRASHAYPIQSMLAYIRRKSFEIDPNAIIAQRLKRTPSILAKLLREDGKLDRMEDIAGCRIVVDNLSKVYEARDNIVNGSTRNALKRERNYISNPKQSGYRGIHLIYAYKGAKSQYIGHSVELQIRSKVQHSWATAVEVVGTFTGQALKASDGPEDWLEFFKLASIAFEDLENKKLAKNSGTEERLKLIKSISVLRVIPRLKAFAVSTKHLGTNDSVRGDYYLLTLEIDKSNIKIRSFPSENFEEATKQYANLEKEFQDNKDRDVVLVAAESIKGLKKAYPNYFADTTDFSKNIERVLNANQKRLINLALIS